MTKALLRKLEPTPSAIEELAPLLTAQGRAEIEWFPHSFRLAFIEPLSRAPSSSFLAVLDEVVVDGVRSLLRLGTVLNRLAANLDEHLLIPLSRRAEQRRHELIEARVGGR